MPVVPATVESIAATVQARIDAVAATVEPMLDALAPGVEPCSAGVLTPGRGSGGEHVVAVLDAVATAIQAGIDAISAAVESPVDAVAAVMGDRRGADGEEQG